MRWLVCCPLFLTVLVFCSMAEKQRTEVERLWQRAPITFCCHPTPTASLALWLRRPPRERKIPGSDPVCDGIFPGLSHTSDLEIGTPVATLPGAWCYKISAGTGWPGVSILWLGEMGSLICSFYLSVAARTIVWADPSQRYTRMLLGR